MYKNLNNDYDYIKSAKTYETDVINYLQNHTQTSANSNANANTHICKVSNVFKHNTTQHTLISRENKF